jgi:hypothetical protein
MSRFRAAPLCAKIAAIAGALAIAIAAPSIDATISVADDGSSSQTPPATPDGHPWIG